MGEVLGKLILGILAQFLTADTLENLLLWLLDKLAQSTQSEADDELVEIVRKAFGKAEEPRG